MGLQKYGITYTALVLTLFAGVSHAKATTSTKHSPSLHQTSGHHSKSQHAKSKKVSARGQRAIDPQRTREIQTALIREHYLSGEPSGNWDQETKDALVRYQQENGWQTKVLPDSRALIKLGLGPDRTGLLNPDTAYMPSPHELGVDHETQPGGSATQP